MTTATWNGATIAESDKTVVVEGNHYFPPGSVRKEFLQASSTTSRCPWKGTARYYSLVVAGKTKGRCSARTSSLVPEPNFGRPRKDHRWSGR